MFLFSLDLSTRPWQFPSLRDLGFLCLIPEFFGGGADFSQQEKLDFSFLIPHFVRGEGSMEDKSVCPSFRYTCSMPFRTKLFLSVFDHEEYDSTSFQCVDGQEKGSKVVFVLR